MSRRARLWAVGTVATLVSTLLVVLAVRDPGYAAQSVELSQSTVWVTNNSSLLVGRVNKQIDELDSAVKVSGTPFDVFQDGDSVLVVDGSKHELRPLDVVSVTLAGKVSLPTDASVAFGGGVVAIADEATGAVWMGTPEELADLDPATTPPTVSAAPGAALAVSQSGAVAVVAPGLDTVWTSPGSAVDAGASASTEADGAVAEESAELATGTLTLPGGPLSRPVSGTESPVSVTMVGDVPVVLDRAAGTIRLPSVAVTIPDASTAVLQQSGPVADDVLVATSAALLRISLEDGSMDTVVDGRSGAPAAPVVVRGCAHAAWSSEPAAYALTCGGGEPAVRDIPGHSGVGAMVFRVNHDVVVLNDVVTGAVWTTDADMKLIKNWDQVEPLSDADDQSDDNSGTQGRSQEDTSSRTNCEVGKTDPPTATDDEFGVRGGRSTVLRVLANDMASDCSVPTITDAEGWSADDSSGPAVQIVDNGRALQVTVPEGAAGELPALHYRVSDGSGHTAAATVTVTAAPDDVHQPPVKVHDSSVPVETLGTVSYNVLSNFRSPTGDDLFLVAASVDAANAGDEVSFQPNGIITYFDKGVGGAVKKSVHFQVSDGVTAPVAGTLTVDVRPEGTAEPSTSPVFAHAVTDRPVTVDILRQVTTPSVAPTTLAKVTAFEPTAQAMVGALDQSAGTVVIRSSKSGTFYFTYEVDAGGVTAVGLLRVDVTEPVSQVLPPVTMVDTVYLPAGGVVSIDPTSNDSDPMANGLAVIQARPDAALTATVEGMQTVTISAQSVLSSGAAEVGYTVSNGAASADGTIRVVPVPAAEPVPPIAHDIDATVRVGDAITIPISEHAVDPGGDIITLTGLGAPSPAIDGGVLFHTDRAIRLLAPASAPARPYRFTYTVANTSGAKAVGVVTLRVVAPPAQDNPPATPAPVLARVFTDSTVSIPLPLDGIDPDGDWVMLDAITEPSTSPLGTPAPSGIAAITYRAGSAPGYDTFGYRAIDPSGEATTGVVSVLVVPKPELVQAPTAPNLTVTVRPGRTVQIDAVSEASTVNPGQRLSFDEHPFDAPTTWSVDVSPSGGALLVTTPTQETVASIKYTVVNEAGLAGSGIVTVTVSSTAPIKPPTAHDVVVDPSDIVAGQRSVEVDIPEAELTNPGGTVADLTLTLDGDAAAASSVVGARTVRVPLTDVRQVLAYRVTNADDVSATALIVVPGLGDVAPPQSELPEDAQPSAPLLVAFRGSPLQVRAGETLTVDVTRSIAASDDSTLTVPNGAVISVVGSGTAGRVDATHVRYAAPKDGDGTVTLSVPVTDGGRDAVVALPVTVIPLDIPAPVVSDAALSVEAGSSIEQDLAGLVTAGNEEQQKLLTYEISGGDSGFSVSLRGSVVTVSAELAARDRSVTVTVTATDGQGKSGTGTLVVTATGSTAPRLKVGNIVVNDGRPGKASTVDLLDAVTYNPFDGAPTVVAARVASGSGTVSDAGPTVSITPSEVGTVVVTFTVRDATGDETRDVQGTVTVTVQDRPDKPGTPTVVSMSSRTVELMWTAPDDNGSEITGYVVTADDYTHPCATFPCTLDDLTNGRQYQFSVTAVNGVGESDPSEPSAPVVPDTAPNLPAPPVLTWTSGATSLDVAWTDPGSDGTPVDRYDLRISPADENGTSEVVVTGETSYQWTDLAFGQAYTVTVQAHNASDTPSGWSSPSASETPSTTSSAPTDLAVTFGVDAYDSDGHTLAATWTAPGDTGGAALTGYRVTVSPAIDGKGSWTIDDPGTTELSLQRAVDGTTYTVKVAAVNRSGPGETVQKSVTPYSLPDTVQVTKATATGNDRQISLEWKSVAGHGKPIDRYEIGGDATGTAAASATTKTVTVPKNGTDYTITVRACYADNTCGGTGSMTANAYGPVAVPAEKSGSPSRAQTSVTFSWNDPADNGRPEMFSQWSTNGSSGWTTGTSKKVTAACGGKTATIYIRGADGAGHYSTVKKLTGTTTSCPAPTQWTVRTTNGTCPEYDFTGTHFVNGNCTSNDGAGHSGFIPNNTDLTVTCYRDDVGGTYRLWYKIKGPYYVNWFVAAGTTNHTSKPSGMPKCG